MAGAIVGSARRRFASLLVMSYRGDWIEGQNQFRRLMLEKFTPNSHTPMELMPVAASVHGQLGFNDTTEDKLTTMVASIAALKLPLDTFWLDAGWNEGGFPHGQGNPKADATRFPRGLGPVGKAVREKGMRFLPTGYPCMASALTLPMTWPYEVVWEHVHRSQ